jgi:hypothetical protein
MRNRIITSTDYETLKILLADDVSNKNISSYTALHLYMILETSQVLKSEIISENIITMNSVFIVRDLHTETYKQKKLVYPNRNFDSELWENLSIYDPLGLAVYGYKQNDLVDCSKYIMNNNKDSKFLIEKILFQPEASQLYYM